MDEGIKYYNSMYNRTTDFMLADGVNIWVPTGRGFFFPNWDWTDAPYRKGSDQEVNETGEPEEWRMQ
jgi:hypothetical protein